MAVIERIRRRSGLVIAIIGIALVAFVLGDLLKNPWRKNRDTMAVVNGERITYAEWKNLKDADAGRNGDDAIVSNNLYERLVRDVIMKEEFEALGITVSPNEGLDLFLGDEPHPSVASRYANDPSFTKELVSSLFMDLDNAHPDFIAWKDAIEKDRLETKFRNLVGSFDFVPTKLAEKYYQDNNTKYTAEVVALRYSDIPEPTEFSNKDKKKFYEEFKAKYPATESRDIEYVVFDVTPSQEDIDAIQKEMADMKEEFQNTDAIANWVDINSDTGFPYDSTWKKRSEVPATIESVVFEEGNQPGFVYGPYVDGDYYNLARIVDLQERADSLRANLILITYGDYSENGVTMESAQKLADSLVNVLNVDSNKFDELAQLYSIDTVAGKKGGDTDWFVDKPVPYAPYPPVITEFIVNNPIGKIGSVEMPGAFIVIKVADKAHVETKARIAVVKRMIKASPSTYENAFSDASAFAADIENYKQFTKAVEARGLAPRVFTLTKNTTAIAGVEQPRELVRWAFKEETKVGDVESFFKMQNMFVVAALTDTQEEGDYSMDKFVERYHNEFVNWKKGQIAVEKMAALDKNYSKMVSDLKATEVALPGITRNLENLPLGFGKEGKIVGTILGMKPGDAPVGPIAGNTCAFIIKKVEVVEPEATSDYSEVIQSKKDQFAKDVFGVYNALKKIADIEDNRTDFF